MWDLGDNWAKQQEQMENWSIRQLLSLWALEVSLVSPFLGMVEEFCTWDLDPLDPLWEEFKP